MAPSLLPVLRSRLQGELLALVLGAPEREWTIGDLAGAVGQAYPSVATELRRLGSRRRDRDPYDRSLAIGTGQHRTAHTSSRWLAWCCCPSGCRWWSRRSSAG